MRPPKLASARGMRVDALATLLAAALILALVMFGAPGTAALFTADYPQVVSFGTGQVFPGERVSPAFKVSDHSSGSAVDASSPIAFVGDGRLVTTTPWASTFASDRYVDLGFNAPLPANVALSAASFDLSWASAAGTACMYFEIRRSDGTLLDVQGSSGSTLSCTSSIDQVALVTPLPTLATTDDANGSTVRIFVSSSAAAATIMDRAVLRATYGATQYTLYPVDVTDAADGSPSLDHWGLARP